MRRRSLTALLAIVAACSLVVTSCGDETEDETRTTAADTTTTTEAGDDAPGMPDATLRFTTADGTIDLDFVEVVCTSADETTFNASGEVDGTTITTESAGQVGNVVLQGDDEFDGTIIEVAIGDTGGLVATGTGSAPEPGSTATEFTIRGQCN